MPANFADNLHSLIGMGFPEAHARFALERHQGDLDKALNFCVENDVGTLMTAERQASRRLSSSSLLLRPDEQESDLANEHAECCVCFEPMHSAPAGVLVDPRGNRVCWHFMHDACARSLHAAGQRGCPLCRAPFDRVLRVPDITQDQDAWFRACDKDGDGVLNPREVLEIIKAQFPVNHERLEAELPSLWREWDESMDGYIQREEFLGPNGLLAFLTNDFAAEASEETVPDIRRDKGAWFDYFDEDKSGDLSVVEVTRGIIKSYKLNENFDKVREIRSIIANVWCVFDHDGSGEVDRDEFLRPMDGMADSIIANFQYHR